MLDKIKNTIHQWIKGLINNDIQYSLLDKNFFMEDGMTLKEYLDYEQYQFSSLSQIYDLNNNFKIKVLDIQTVKNKTLSTIYIVNHLNKIVCKMTLTLIKIDDKLLITGNDYYAQIVPKYRILTTNEKITHLSLAIKTPLHLNNIISSNFELISLSKGDNYNNDEFYHAIFNINDIKFNQSFSFRLVLENKKDIYIEKRNVFLDTVELNLKPFSIENNKLTIINDRYPVHISYEKKNKTYNIEYPRDIQLDLEDISKMTVTDSLDNDWVVK